MFWQKIKDRVNTLTTIFRDKKGVVMAETLSKEIKAWGVLGIVIVLVSIILGKFKDVTGNTAVTNQTVDLFITGLQEPGNWLAIVVIALVGFSLFKFFSNKKSLG